MKNILTWGPLVISVLALLVSGLYGRLSAKAAQKSATEATKSARAAEQVAKADLEREHERLAPDLGGGKFFTLISDLTGQETLFYEVTPNRTYTLRVEKAEGDGRGLALNDSAHRGGLPVRIPVQDLKPARNDPSVGYLEFLVWPGSAPVTGGLDDWACPCGRPLVGPKPHWTVRVPVRLLPENRKRVVTHKVH